jgi:hypothetical protein
VKTDALAQLATQVARAAPSLTFPGDGDLASRLTLGQIIKGRVLRSYEGQRHLVDFGGHEKVVDSAVPLKPGETFRGRVIGLGEQVQLHKLPADAAAVLPETPLPQMPGDSESESLSALFARYRVDLPPNVVEAAVAATGRLRPEPLAHLAALVLAKLSLPLQAALIRALHAHLVGAMAADPARDALHLDTAAPVATRLESAVPALAALLGSQLSGVDNRRAGAQGGGEGDPPGGGNERRRSLLDPGRHILNIQAGGRIAHRLGLLPLVVDGRLLELEVALFDEASDGADDLAAAPRHRQIVIALETAHLGRVEIRASLAGNSMKLTLATPSAESTQALALHAAHLTKALETLGFQVDGQRYDTQAPVSPGGPLRSTIDHIVNPGSVSRWV